MLILKKKVAAGTTPPPPVVLTPPAPKPPYEAPVYSTASLYAGQEPKTCKGCKKVYMAPCDGNDAKCPNWVYLQSVKNVTPTAGSQA